MENNPRRLEGGVVDDEEARLKKKTTFIRYWSVRADDAD